MYIARTLAELMPLSLAQESESATVASEMWERITSLKAGVDYSQNFRFAQYTTPEVLNNQEMRCNNFGFESIAPAQHVKKTCDSEKGMDGQIRSKKLDVVEQSVLQEFPVQGELHVQTEVASARGS